jgi:hypothetical protein
MENGSKKKPCYGAGHFEREAKLMVGIFFALIIVALLAGAIAPWIF